MSHPLGRPLPDWTPRPAPTRVTLLGRTVRLEPLDPARHEDDLWAAAQQANEITGFWDYLPYGPYLDREVFQADVAKNAASQAPSAMVQPLAR